MLDYEIGPIRPPSEAYSLLLRTTVNCPWNRCRFCGIYKGSRFQLRPVADIKQDILAVKAIQDKIKEAAGKAGQPDNIREAAATVLRHPSSDAFFNVALWLYYGGENVFLQDANSLIMRTPDMIEVLRFLKETLPGVTRITSYARSDTAAKKKPAELSAIRAAGLSRLHIGLETGYDPLLKYMDKGVTAAEHIKGGRQVKAAGISLSEYVLLGLGGQRWWREHASETARVLNEIDPDFIRIRTLSINMKIPLHEDIEKGEFVRATDEGIVAEEKLLIENLSCHAEFVSDHVSNLLALDGQLPGDRAKLLAVIERFQSLPPRERANFKLGRRGNIYATLDDMNDEARYAAVERALARLMKDNSLDEAMLQQMMEGFI